MPFCWRQLTQTLGFCVLYFRYRRSAFFRGCILHFYETTLSISASDLCNGLFARLPYISWLGYPEFELLGLKASIVYVLSKFVICCWLFLSFYQLNFFSLLELACIFPTLRSDKRNKDSVVIVGVCIWKRNKRLFFVASPYIFHII